MKEYDVIVIGSGCGMYIVDEALSLGLKVALVDKGPLGGTCPNLGCIPSKVLIYPADRIVEVQEAAKLGIKAQVNEVDFPAIMNRMRRYVREIKSHIKQGVDELSKLDYYPTEGHFTGDYTLKAGTEEIRGKKIFIASGSRTFIPPIEGLKKVPYHTNASLLALREKPESIIIIGGGYVAVEFGHFFAAMGTKVTMLEMADRLVLSEEEEIAAVLRQALAKRMAIHTGARAQSVRQQGSQIAVTAAVGDSTKEFRARHLLMAVGRVSNADRLKVEAAGIATDRRGFISVNEYMETSRKDIYAVGDANGQQMFTHAANKEAQYAAYNGLHNGDFAIDYSAMPHAVYSHPQIASVGMTEAQARQSHDIMVGRAPYTDTAKGEAMMETEGFAKVILEKETGKILGFHIVGASAPMLIQEVVNAMDSGNGSNEILSSTHIHPALSELVIATLGNASTE
jgi:mycothione reductase